MVIDFNSIDDATPKGPDALGKSGGWLIATGGKGAAGIGAGGYLFHKGEFDPIPNTNDTQSVVIKGGCVKATGGADDTDDGGFATGSGAGIGGGAAGTKLKNLTVSDGSVEFTANGNTRRAMTRPLLRRPTESWTDFRPACAMWGSRVAQRMRRTRPRPLPRVRHAKRRSSSSGHRCKRGL